MQQPEGVSMGLLGTLGTAVGSYFGMPEVGAAVGGALESEEGKAITGGLFDFGTSAYSASKQRDFNASQAQLSRDSQIELANTQYQRTVADLNAAGLSPMLAYSRGATSMPSASQASTSANITSDLSGAFKRSAEQDLIREQKRVAEQQYEINVQTAKKVANEAALTAQKVLQEPTRFYYDMAEKGSIINSNTAAANEKVVDTKNKGNLQAPGQENLYRDAKRAATSAWDWYSNRMGQEFGTIKNRFNQLYPGR